MSGKICLDRKTLDELLVVLAQMREVFTMLKRLNLDVDRSLARIDKLQTLLLDIVRGEKDAQSS